jgi:hypothetical protein
MSSLAVTETYSPPFIEIYTKADTPLSDSETPTTKTHKPALKRIRPVPSEKH